METKPNSFPTQTNNNASSTSVKQVASTTSNIILNQVATTPTANSTQSFNSGDTLANLSVTGTNLQWYSSSSGGTTLPISTVLVNGTTYYVSQTVNG